MRWLAVFRRALLPLLGVLLLAPAVPALADSAADRAALDPLFAELAAAPDAGTADHIAQKIWNVWLNPSDLALSRRMAAVQLSQQHGNMAGALQLLSKLVVDYPTYAEGWNQRATIYFMMNDLSDSLADIDKVLQLEPRHFGALSGRVMIYLHEGRRADALHDMVTALAIHPYLSEKQLFPELQQLRPNVTHL